MMRKLRREVKAGREDAARVEAVKMQPGWRARRAFAI
jgi:hypothetical protein